YRVDTASRELDTDSPSRPVDKPMDWRTTPPTLLSRLRDTGDQEAWRTFDRRYGDLIVQYCRGQGLQQSDAEDIRQAVMTTLAHAMPGRSEEHTSELQSLTNLVCRLLLEKKKTTPHTRRHL